MPVKLCSSPRCPHPATYRGKCSHHSRVRERQTNRAGKAIYNTKRWQMTRKAYLAKQPLCETEGCGEIATDVHHRVDLADGGDPWNLEGLEALCHSCHSSTTRQRQLTS